MKRKAYLIIARTVRFRYSSNNVTMRCDNDPRVGHKGWTIESVDSWYDQVKREIGDDEDKWELVERFFSRPRDKGLTEEQRERLLEDTELAMRFIRPGYEPSECLKRVIAFQKYMAMRGIEVEVLEDKDEKKSYMWDSTVAY